jgi:hypothetical protein
MTAMRAVWVFALDGSDEIEVPDALAAALGVAELDEDFVEQFRVDILLDYGFATYMTDAMGMDADQIAPDAALLNALTGTVVLVVNTALPAGVTPDPRPPLRLIGYYEETVKLRVPEPLVAQSAQGTLDGAPVKRTSDAAMMGRVATVALLVIFALTALVIWVAS